MNVVRLILVFVIMNITLTAQPEPERVDGVANFTDEAIRHKNMELICPINWEDGHNDEMIEFIKIGL